MFCWFITLLLIFLAKYNIWSDLDIDFSSKFYIKSIASAVQSWLRFFADVNFSSCTLDIFNSALTVKRTTSEGESSASRSVDDWRCRRRWLLHVLWCEAYPPLHFFSSFLSPSQFIFAISPSFLLIGPLLYFPSLLFLSRPFPFPNLSLYLLTHAPPWMSLSPSFLFHRFPVPSLPIPLPSWALPFKSSCGCGAM